jgi:hypothetical protein
VSNGDAIKYGILSTRDLVELYLGARTVVTIIENQTNTGASSPVVLNQNPSRIRYEVILGNSNVVGINALTLASPAACDSGFGPTYFLNPGQTIVIERNFETDGEAVCLPLNCAPIHGLTTISTRETILTPLPADESP